TGTGRAGKAKVDVALWGAARARLLNHRGIASRPWMGCARRRSLVSRLARAAQRLCWTCRAPLMRIAGGAKAMREGVDGSVAPIGSKCRKTMVYEPLTRDFARPPRPQFVPVRPIFFLIYQF